MIAYCDPKTGDILFAEKKSKYGLVIAEHPNVHALREALESSGAQRRTEWKDGKQIGDPVSRMFLGALGETRGVFGVHLAILAAKFGWSVEGITIAV